MPGRRATVGAAVLAASLALVVAGCGGSSGSTSTTSATVTWANGVCEAFTTWQTQLLSLKSTLTGGDVTKDSLDSAASQAKDATDTLVDDLKQLGKPDTQAGQQAKADLDQLSTELDKGAQTIDDAMSNASGVAGVLTAVSTVSTALATMATEVKSTVSELQKLDPKGELEQSFEQADSCKSLLGS